jgi:hypothetical protein
MCSYLVADSSLFNFVLVYKCFMVSFSPQKQVCFTFSEENLAGILIILFLIAKIVFVESIDKFEPKGDN